MEERIDPADDARVIGEFREKYRRPYGITNKAIQVRYGINNDAFPGWVKNGGPQREPAITSFHKFAEDIRRDPRGTAEALSTRRDEPITGKSCRTTWSDRSLGLADTEDAHIAPLVDRQALVGKLRDEPEEGLFLLPRTIYLLHRYGDPFTGRDTLKRCVLPELEELRAKRTPVPDRVKDAARGQIAIALCEGGDHEESRRRFKASRSGRSATGSLAWHATAYIRGESLCTAWYDRLRGKALDSVGSAEALDRSSRHRISLANTRCEICLATGDNYAAWEFIGPVFGETRKHLDQNFDLRRRRFHGLPFDRFHHQFASLVFGIIAKYLVKPGNYRSSGEFEHDLSLAEALVLRQDHEKPKRFIQIGLRSQLQSDGTPTEAFQRLELLVSHCRKSTLTEVDKGLWLALDHLLS